MEKTHLPIHAVYLWTIDQRDISAMQLQAMRQTLNAAERAKVARLRLAQMQQTAVISRGSVRIILGNLLAIPPETCQFVTNAQDKPALAPPAALHFNVAHSGDFVLVAVAKTAVGVDIEQINPERDYGMIARRYFSGWETAVFHTIPAADQPQAFYNCWTRKEAYLKAIGTGLTTKLDSFDVEFRPEREPKLLQTAHAPQNVGRWRLVAVQTAVCKMATEYAAALAVDTSINEIRYFRLETKIPTKINKLPIIPAAPGNS